MKLLGLQMTQERASSVEVVNIELILQTLILIFPLLHTYMYMYV